MKLIILEGGDRLGKSTLIEGICGYYNYDNISIRHFGKPPKNLSPKEVLDFQFNSFDNEIRLIESFKSVFFNQPKYYEDIVIWNRSHLGEYVYSQMFRGGNAKDLESKLLTWEEFMLLPLNIEIYLITLTSDPDFFLDKEDGNSFSQTLEEKTKELELFKEIHSLSFIKNKLLLKVDKDGYFKFKKNILDDTLYFINYGKV